MILVMPKGALPGYFFILATSLYYNPCQEFGKSQKYSLTLYSVIRYNRKIDEKKLKLGLFVQALEKSLALAFVRLLTALRRAMM
jgi:hypothetical protein